MRNFRGRGGFGPAVGAAPRGCPAVDGSDTGHATTKPHHVGRGLAPAVGGAPYPHSSLFTLPSLWGS